MGSDGNEDFKYLISTRSSILVVTFLGLMDDSAVETIQRCKSEVEAIENINLVILYFRDVSRITGNAITAFTLLQLSIRANLCSLSICSMQPTIRDKLVKMGVIRVTEISNNLVAAFGSYIDPKKLPKP